MSGHCYFSKDDIIKTPASSIETLIYQFPRGRIEKAIPTSKISVKVAFCFSLFILLRFIQLIKLATTKIESLIK